MTHRVINDKKTGRIIKTLSNYSDALLPKAYSYIENNSYPTIEGLAMELRAFPLTLTNWSEKFPAFKTVYELVLLKQKNSLIQNGINGTNNVIMSIFLLKANHGLRDRPEDQREDEDIIVETISYDNQNKKAKRELKSIKKRTKRVTKRKKIVDENENEGS